MKKIKKLAMILSLTLLAMFCMLGATACDIFESPCEHQFVERTDINATCLETGKLSRTCELCGKEEVETIKALGHTYKTTTTEATCEKSGSEVTKCTRCNDVKSQKSIDATGHDTQLKNANSRPANCKEKAYCGDCKKTYGEVLTDHEYVEVVEAKKNPTCTEVGWEEYTHCGVCAYTTKQEISALGHDKKMEVAGSYQETCKYGAFCGRCRTTYSDPLKHKTQNTIVQIEAKRATCDEDGWETYEYCKECTYTTKTIIPKFNREHVRVDAAEIAATCTENGYKAGVICGYCLKTLSGRQVIPALGHDGYREGQKSSNGKITYLCEASKIDTCTSYGYCDICGVEYGTKSHDVGLEVKGSKAATCTEAAYCAKCKSSYGEPIGHELETVAAELYCDKKGHYEYEQCTRNGCTYNTKVEAEALGHIEVIVKAVAPTCTENGYKEGIQCSRCAQYLVFPQTILALGHDGERAGQKDEGDLLSTASRWKTCTTYGYCGLCGQSYGEANGSHNIQVVEEKEATCFESGWNSYIMCTNEKCNYSTYEANFLPREQHEYTDYPRMEPTCTTQGYKECRICIKCEERPVLEALGHDVNCTRNSESKGATCTSRAYCGDCGVYYGESPKGTHTAGDAATCTTARVCLDCGQVLQDALGHVQKADGTCARCGKQIKAIVKKENE